MAERRARFARFGLSLHPDKTRLLAFGPYADRNRRGRGQGKPDTFNFLGFTHSGGKKRSGRVTVLRQTVRQRVQAKLQAVKAELRRRMHLPIPEQGASLRSVVSGHVRYYGVPMNGRAISQEAIEAPRFNSLHHHSSFSRHGFGDKDGRAGVLQVEDRIPPGVIEALRGLGHRVEILGPFMMDTGTALAGIDPQHGTLFGAADVRRERFVTGW